MIFVRIGKICSGSMSPSRCGAEFSAQIGDARTLQRAVRDGVGIPALPRFARASRSDRRVCRRCRRVRSPPQIAVRQLRVELPRIDALVAHQTHLRYKAGSKQAAGRVSDVDRVRRRGVLRRRWRVRGLFPRIRGASEESPARDRSRAAASTTSRRCVPRRDWCASLGQFAPLVREQRVEAVRCARASSCAASWAGRHVVLCCKNGSSLRTRASARRMRHRLGQWFELLRREFRSGPSACRRTRMSVRGRRRRGATRVRRARR